MKKDLQKKKKEGHLPSKKKVRPESGDLFGWNIFFRLILFFRLPDGAAKLHCLGTDRKQLQHFGANAGAISRYCRGRSVFAAAGSGSRLHGDAAGSTAPRRKGRLFRAGI